MKKDKKKGFRAIAEVFSGDDRTRTDHPLIANQMLYQMSYAPE